MNELQNKVNAARKILDDHDMTDRTRAIETALYDLLREVEKHLNLLTHDERFFSQGEL
jgi:hypothetical protein